MRIVFFGTPDVAAFCLAALVEAGHDTALVITRPDRPAGRSRKPVPCAAKRWAVERGLAVEHPRVRSTGFAERLERLAPAVLVVVAYGRILPRRLLDVAPHGAVNLHFSLLPRYRGAAPVQWALARGARVTGVTTMRLNEAMDAGDLLLQQELRIEPDEHAPALRARLAAIGAVLLVETLDRLQRGDLRPRAQDPAGATAAPMLSPADGEIDPADPAASIEGRVRGFDPWPGVWLSRDGRRLRIVEARALDERAAEGVAPGTVVALNAGKIALACGARSLLELLRVQTDGRRAASVRDAVNGRQLAPGDRLESLASPPGLVPRGGSG